MRKKIGLYAGVVLFALAGLCAPARAAEVGQPAPPLTVREFDGSTFDLAALKGKVVILNIWASWCAPCRAEMPVLDAFYRAHKQQGVEVIALSADSPRDADDARDVMHSFALPAALLRRAEPNGFGMPDEIPVTYIVDAKGIIRARLTPDATPLSDKVLSNIVLPLLGR